nr:hybrid sensor histidine kinase/response regulator [Saliniradius amylolyticus]
MTLFWILAALLYMGALFLLARWGDHRQSLAHRLSRHPAIYALGLGIYCTSWTYYGAVGSAAKEQWQFLPILLGPILLFVFGFPVLRKMVAVSKRQNITSIADFLSSRYGKRRDIAVLVTLLMTFATLPYIALQLKAVDTSFSVLAGLESGDQGYLKALITTAIMAVFAVFFGTRHNELTQYRSGLMLAIGSESLVKLFGLCVAAVFAAQLLTEPQWEPQQMERIQQNWLHWQGSTFEFVVQTLMAGAVILCLPRQFQVMVVDNHNPTHLNMARWLFPLYLLLTIFAIIPIAIAGELTFGGSVDPDTYLMQLAGSQGSYLLSLMVFTGGISAAGAMIIVSSLALSTMLTNDVILPLLMRNNPKRWLTPHKYSRALLPLRRAVIIIILLMSYAYYSIWGNQTALASMGLLAFSLVIQVVPFILGGLYWKRAHASGVLAGLAVGLAAWGLFIGWPLVALGQNPTGQVIAEGTVISLLASTCAYVLFSFSAGQRLLDRVQASAFVTPFEKPAQAGRLPIYSQTRFEDLKQLLETFLGKPRTDSLIRHYQRQQGVTLTADSAPDDDLIQYCERALTSVLGSSSARTLVAVLLSGQRMDVEQVFNVFEDTTQALQNHQAILFNSLENLSQGISVIDKELRLVAWNKAYLDLFDYPSDMVEVGQPIETLIRFNAERGECGPGDVQQHVQKRLNYLRQGSPQRFVRQRRDGRVIEINGNPLPQGGFVTSFSDITRHVELQKALEDANIDLEARIRDRTQEISAINAELERARLQAEQANESKSRFLALASHDILQPLNAAKLYLSAVDDNQLSPANQSSLGKLGDALQTSEQLISTLLEIAKLEQGALQPSLSEVALGPLLNQLEAAYHPMADHNGVRLTVRSTPAVVKSDATYLRRILQNLISNAIKYSPNGRVLVGARRRGEQWLIQVWDNGLGIAPSEQRQVFDDFYRAHRGQIRGVGLGLSVVQKMSDQLGHPVTLNSELGSGSCFNVLVPAASGQHQPSDAAPITSSGDLNGLRVLFVDDNPTNLDALKALLDKWHCHGQGFTRSEDALSYADSYSAPDVLIMDYQLNNPTEDGLSLIATLRQRWQADIPALLVTAAREEDLRKRAREQGVGFLGKPIKAGALRAWLSHQRRAD